MNLKKIICFSLFLTSSLMLSSQGLPTSSIDAESVFSEERVLGDLMYLCSPECEGRASGTQGSAKAAGRISERFADAGLLMFGDSYEHHFTVDGKQCTNLIGYLPAFGAMAADKYIVVAAHYDGLGCKDGYFYQGADCNATGVVALDEIARMFRYMYATGRIYPQNIMFVALDAKQDAMAGSRELWRSLCDGDLVESISGKHLKGTSVTLFVNLDILGGTQTLLKSGREDFILMLGGSARRGEILHESNRDYHIDLEVCLDYFGSKGFTDMFLKRVSDQKPFYDAGIQSIMFTSGITMDTNKETDTVDKVSVPILFRRVRLVFHWLNRAIYSN